MSDHRHRAPSSLHREFVYRGPALGHVGEDVRGELEQARGRRALILEADLVEARPATARTPTTAKVKEERERFRGPSCWPPSTASLRGDSGLIARNPARGKRRRVKASKPAPVWLESAEQIAALLDGAGELDRSAKSNGKIPRRAILATLTFAGLRIGELIDLRWRDVNLAEGRITARESKTDAGVRTIDLLPALRDELVTVKAAGASASDRVFPTQEGGPMNASNVRGRILAPAVTLANERLDAAALTPLPEGLTPHKLRHTFASLLVALGVDPGAVMDQLGHADPTFTLRVYRHAMRRDQRSKEALQILVGHVSDRFEGSRSASGRVHVHTPTVAGSSVAASWPSAT